MVAKKVCSSDFSRTVAVVGRAAVAAIYVLFLVGWRGRREGRRCASGLFRAVPLKWVPDYGA